MHWELWDTETNNLVATFATEDEARHGVRDVLSRNAVDYVDVLTLGAMSDPGDPVGGHLPPTVDGAEIVRWLDAPESKDNLRATA